MPVAFLTWYGRSDFDPRGYHALERNPTERRAMSSPSVQPRVYHSLNAKGVQGSTSDGRGM